MCKNERESQKGKYRYINSFLPFQPTYFRSMLVEMFTKTTILLKITLRVRSIKSAENHHSS